MVVIQRKRSNHSTPSHIPDSRKQCDEMAITETEGDCEDSDGPSRRKRKKTKYVDCVTGIRNFYVHVNVILHEETLV